MAIHMQAGWQTLCELHFILIGLSSFASQDL